MNQQPIKRRTTYLFCIAVTFIPFISSCGSSDSSSDTQVKPPAIEQADSDTPTPTPIPTPVPSLENKELSQVQIEQIAKSSLNSAIIEDDFVFQSQRNIRLDLHFTDIQLATKLDIYSALDAQTNTPINLLEQGVINQSIRYKSSLSVSNDIETLFIVRNDDKNNFVEVNINQKNNINYHFEEY